ncbi:MAG TPA: metal ABC transporter permease [Candidatus Eremiobacteraeota bacterium]|nr:MAG: High-affinity zinc uptake system membrane protein ZnuB [bacterium ADurb.Bin363]HPZ09276.1 metal ABC transporter permease [Candidatus Eremiobacteraeota bacterium]
MIEMLKLPFMQTALMASLIVGFICSFAGVYIVLKRIVFVGAAIANISTAGIAFALLMGLNPEIFSIVFAIVGVMVFSISVKSGEKKIPAESIIGISYAVSSALGILLVAKSAQGESHVLSLIFGNILAVPVNQLKLIALVFPFIILIHYLFYKEFLFTSFDPEMAKTLGIKTTHWEILFYLTVGLIISMSIHVGGALLTFTYLVIPATTALLITDKIKFVFIFSVIFGLLSSFFGMYFSYIIDLPSGPTIVVTSFIICIVVIIISEIKNLIKK